MLRSIIPYKYTKAKKVFAIFSSVLHEESLKILLIRENALFLSAQDLNIKTRLSVYFLKQTDSLVL